MFFDDKNFESESEIASQTNWFALDIKLQVTPFVHKDNTLKNGGMRTFVQANYVYMYEAHYVLETV